MDLSFSGAGFMGCYYFGVVDCWNKYIPRDRVNRVAGASAGSLIAAYYLIDLPLGSCLKAITELTEDIRRRPLGVFDRSNQIVDLLPRILDELFPEDAHKRVSGRLHVCMTRMKDMKKVIVNEFDTKKDLIDALNCSCFIPVWSGNHVSTYKGVKHIDGGFSDNLPVFDEHTVRICCFSGASDISPYDRAKMELLSGTVLNTPLYLNFANCRRFRKALFPPPASYIVDLLQRGFHDAKDFILSNDLIQCDACYRKTDFRSQPIYSKKSPTLTPSVSPALTRAGSLRDLRRDVASEAASAAPESGSTFNKLLSAKLEACPSRSNDSPRPVEGLAAPTIRISLEQAEEPASDANNNTQQASATERHQGAAKENAEPEVALDEAECPEGGSPGSERRQHPRKRARPTATTKAPLETGAPEKFLGARRNTTQLSAGSLLVLEDKFTLAPNPLPSCPPSPNLNRHCSECISMRQGARLDLVCEEIRREAARYAELEPAREGFSSMLMSPLRWIRQFGAKHSYKLRDEPGDGDIDKDPTNQRQQQQV